VTLKNSMTLYRGGREIQLLSFGRGHTGGDVVVYLPKEKVLAAGDLLWAGAPGFMGDGYLAEWADTLEELKKLDVEAVIPGHGEVIVGAVAARERITVMQAYLRDLWKKAGEMKTRGVSAADAAKQIDMTSHKTGYPQITAAGVDPRAVTRIYQVLDEQAKR
jgi:glyoxylase-like metal-dependent hydrolase (beta-lactamase superfamily II)